MEAQSTSSMGVAETELLEPALLLSRVQLEEAAHQELESDTLIWDTEILTSVITIRLNACLCCAILNKSNHLSGPLFTHL